MAPYASRTCSLAALDPQGQLFQAAANDDDVWGMRRTKSLPCALVDPKRTEMFGTKGRHEKAEFSIDCSTQPTCGQECNRLQVDQDVTVNNVVPFLGQNTGMARR